MAMSDVCNALDLYAFLKAIPKADIHYHLLGGVRIETMQALAEKYGVPLSERDAQSYYRRYHAASSAPKGGIAALNFLYPLMQEPGDYFRVASEIFEDAKTTGIRYLELFINPSDMVTGYTETLEELDKAIILSEASGGPTARLIPSISRHKSPEEAVKMVATVLAFPHARVVGIGIDYQEENAPIENFWKAYRLAREGGLRLTGHCSEFGLHWRNVETGLDLIGLERIDHGYTVLENRELTTRCVERGVPFTVVPSNTYYLKLWPDAAEWRLKHPIRAMAKAGMKIIPCTDDWHIHATNGVECYRVMVEDFGFDLDGIRQLMLNGIDASWLPEPQKARWRREWAEEFDTLRKRLSAEPVIPEELQISYGPR